MTESTCQGESRNCSSLTAQHTISEIHVPHSETQINNCHQAFTTMLHWEAHLNSTSAIPKRLLLIRKSARFTIGLITPPLLSAPRWTHHPAALPGTPSMAPSLSNSASFPIPFSSAYTKTKSTVISTGIPAISLFPDLNLIFWCLAKFQFWAAR